MSDPTGQRSNRPLRPAWLEVDLSQMAKNFQLIRADASSSLAIGSVVKDAGYGHGAVEVARVALAHGADCLLVSNLDEAAELRDAGLKAPILLMGERMESELSACLELGLTLAVGHVQIAEAASRLAVSLGQQLKVHVKIDTGMGRYGAHWDVALELVNTVAVLPGLRPSQRQRSRQACSIKALRYVSLSCLLLKCTELLYGSKNILIVIQRLRITLKIVTFT